MRKLAILAALVAAAALSACGEKTIDSGKAEDLARKVTGQAGLKTKSVDCPEDVKVEKGKTFDCDIEFEDGDKATLTMHMTDDDGTVRTTGADFKPAN